MPARPERRKRQLGELVPSPDYRKQNVLMSPKEFAALKQGPKDAPIKIVHRGQRAVVFEDRRRSLAGARVKSTGPVPDDPRVARVGDVVKRLMENLRDRGASEEQIEEFLKRRGMPAQAPGKKEKNMR